LVTIEWGLYVSPKEEEFTRRQKELGRKKTTSRGSRGFVRWSNFGKPETESIA